MNIRKNQIKIIKKHFKQKNMYLDYKSTFLNKQMRFILTKINLIFTNDLNVVIKEKEENIFKNSSNKDVWIEIINNLKTSWNINFINVDWNSFAIFLFYTYHYSEFYFRKSKLKNLYTQENFTEINKVKIQMYNNWIKSMYETEVLDFNKYIIKVLELVK